MNLHKLGLQQTRVWNPTSRSFLFPFFHTGVLAAAVLAFLSFSAAAAERLTQNLVLITLDGVRIEEMFGGVDLKILQAESKENPVENHALYRQYWAPTAEERRVKLMPFFWGTWMKDWGSIAGNPERNSSVQLSNRLRFSYPGYSEFLTGKARDGVITSNDKIQNPHPTVLEYLKDHFQLGPEQAAVFACWDVMPWIAQQETNSLRINAGFMAYQHPDPDIQKLSQLQFETPTPWDSVRHDYYTFRFAMAHLRLHRPKILYLSLGETDDWAHDKRYDRVLQALVRTDRYLKELWEFLQSQDMYRGKTTILMTTDHGRGNNEYTWPNHGAKVEGAQNMWMAFVSPDAALRGEWSNHEPIYLSQAAATACRFLGLDYSKTNSEAGLPIELLFR